MIETMDIESGINTIISATSPINTELDVNSECNFIIELTSQIFPEMDKISEINLEEV